MTKEKLLFHTTVILTFKSNHIFMKCVYLLPDATLSQFSLIHVGAFLVIWNIKAMFFPFLVTTIVTPFFVTRLSSSLFKLNPCGSAENYNLPSVTGQACTKVE